MEILPTGVMAFGGGAFGRECQSEEVMRAELLGMGLVPG